MRDRIISEIDEFRRILTAYLMGHELTEDAWDSLRNMTTLSIKNLKQIQPKSRG